MDQRRHAEFVCADIRDRPAVVAALRDIDVVFHQAAYGGYMPDMAKYVEVSAAGTAGMLELIRDQRQPVSKVVVASSQAVYAEGAATCGRNGLVFPKVRPMDQLLRGDFAVYCPRCGGPTDPASTPEEARVSGESMYAISKVAQERITLTWARQTGIPAVALRYSCTYGPRQSIFNPYTGVIAIVCTRVLSGERPIVYEDGLQTRDFCFVEDVAEANLLAATGDAWDGQAVNVGSGTPTAIRDLCTLLAEAAGVRLEVVARGEVRPGEIRHLTADISRARAAGFAPATLLAAGLERYVAWIREQADVRDYFSAAEALLRTKGIVHRVRGESAAVGPATSISRRGHFGRVSVVVPALNEAATIGQVVAAVPRDVAGEVIVVDNGSTDATADRAREAGGRVVSEPRRGYGRACHAGVRVLDRACEIVVFLDGDRSDRPELMDGLVRPIVEDRYDFVVGSRVLGRRERGSMTWSQLIAGGLAGLLVRLLYGVRFTDMCPFRAIRRDALDRLGMREETYGWNLEMQMRAARAGLRILEVPVAHRRRAGGAFKVSGTVRGTWAAATRIVRDVRPGRRRAGRTRLSSSRAVARWTALTLGVHAAILAAPLVGVGLYGQFGTAGLHDVRIYFDYASRAIRGAVPYRDYPVEYPPLAMLVFVIPRLATSRFGSYAALFAAEMLLFDALALYCIARYAAAREGVRVVPARLGWYTAFFAALYPVVGSRYDLAPAAVALAGALAWIEGRPVAGGLVTAAGTLMKIFPAAVAVPAAVFELAAARVTRVRGLLTFAVATVAGGIAWYAVGGVGSLTYQAARGLQIETTWAGALLLADKIVGITPTWRYSHTSVELVAPGAGLLAAVAIPAQIATLGAVVWRSARSGRRDLVRYAAAAILVLVVAGKVLSPQYLIWLVPFVPVLGGPAGRIARPLFVIACAATTLEYLATRHLAAFELWAILALNGRNALLVALLLVLLGRGRDGQPEPARD